MPKVTFLLPAYNAESYISETLDSLLNQDYKDYDILVIDDGSTDNTYEVISHFNSNKIKLIRNESNLGLIKTLNKGLSLIQSKYIARIDSDDLCMTNRLDRQVSYMDSNSNCGVCGSSIQYFPSAFTLKLPVNDSRIKFDLIFRNAIAHPSVMLRNSVLQNFKYSEYFPNAEDYELWTRMAPQTRFFNLPEVLVKYRIHNNQISSRNSEKQSIISKEIRKIYLQKFLDLKEDPDLFLETIYNPGNLTKKQKLKLILKTRRIGCDLAEFFSSKLNRGL